MTEMRSSYALIPLGNGEYGIFTDRDLRTRVVAVDRSVADPVRTVMSAPARVVSDDRLVTTVLIEMIEHGMRHMPVVNERGQILGVLEDSDLLAASTRRSFVLRRAIALSATAETWSAPRPVSPISSSTWCAAEPTRSPRAGSCRW